MENTYVLSFLINGLLGIAMFFMKLNNDQTKETLSNLRSDLELVKSTTMKKEDFREFKEELWKRLDRMEDSLHKSQ